MICRKHLLGNTTNLLLNNSGSVVVDIESKRRYIRLGHSVVGKLLCDKADDSMFGQLIVIHLSDSLILYR